MGRTDTRWLVVGRTILGAVDSVPLLNVPFVLPLLMLLLVDWLAADSDLQGSEAYHAIRRKEPPAQRNTDSALSNPARTIRKFLSPFASISGVIIYWSLLCQVGNMCVAAAGGSALTKNEKIANCSEYGNLERYGFVWETLFFSAVANGRKKIVRIMRSYEVILVIFWFHK